jgi:hypothetical protein
MVNADLGTAQAAEIFLSLIGAGTIEAISFLMVDALHFEPFMQRVPCVTSGCNAVDLFGRRPASVTHSPQYSYKLGPVLLGFVNLEFTNATRIDAQK